MKNDEGFTHSGRTNMANKKVLKVYFKLEILALFKGLKNLFVFRAFKK